jgi:hypothetical protein
MLLVFTALLFLYLPLSAQDANYWTYQYGTRAELLGGVVVGSIKDLSSTFYNPGAVAFSMDQGLLLTLDAFEVSNISLNVENSEESYLSDTKAIKAPGMFAIRFPFDVPGDNQIALSYLTRSQFELELSDNYVNSWWDPGWEGGDASFSSEFQFYERLTDTWFGVSWAKAFTERMAFGATLYGAYRNQRMRLQTFLDGAQLSGPGASASYFREYRYWNARALLKAGASFDFRPLAFGLALTLPSISLFGNGSFYYNDSVVNFDLDQNGVPDSYLASNFQEDLSTTYKSPFSISVGTSYGYKTFTIHFSAEYFGKMDTYEIMDVEDFRAQTSGDTLSPVVTGGMKEVFNYGFGLDYRFHDKFSLYGGFTTDRTGWMQDVNTTITGWDLYHVTLGSAFRAIDIDWTIGLGYSWGSEDFSLTMDYAGDDGSEGVIDPEGLDSRMEYNKIKLILGFAFPTKEKKGTSGG